MSEAQESLDAIFKALGGLNLSDEYREHLEDLREKFVKSRTAADAGGR